MIQKMKQTAQVTNRHRALGLTDQDVLSMYENMLKARRVDERLWLLNRAGKSPLLCPVKVRKQHKSALHLA